MDFFILKENILLWCSQPSILPTTDCLHSNYHMFKQKVFFCDWAWKENIIIQCTLSVKLNAPQISLFDVQAWKHYSMEIIGYKNIYLLHKDHTFERKHIFFHGLVWKHFAVYLIGQTGLTVRLKARFCGDYLSQQWFT